MLVSVAPQSTVKFVPFPGVLNAGAVVIVPPAVFMVMMMSEVATASAFAIVIVPPPVQTNVPLRAAINVTAPVVELMLNLTPAGELYP